VRKCLSGERKEGQPASRIDAFCIRPGTVPAGAMQHWPQLVRTIRRFIVAGILLVTNDTSAFTRVPGLMPKDGVH